MTKAILQKIDCIMLRVDDLQAGREFYERTMGLTPLWSDEHSIAFGMPECDAEIVIHENANIPRECSVHYMVKDVPNVVRLLETSGCRMVAPPFDVAIGKCAVMSDPFGNVLSLIDMSKGPVKYNLKER
jgi:lactoylglutathione lyase